MRYATAAPPTVTVIRPRGRRAEGVATDQEEFIAALRDLVQHPPGPLGQGLV